MYKRGTRVIVGFFLRNIYTLMNIVLAFFMMPFILHHLGDRMYGLWTLMGSFTGYMGFLDFGLTAAVSRLISRAVGRKDPKEINEIVNTAFVVYAVLSMIVVLVTIGLMLGAGWFVKVPGDLYIVRILLLCIGINLTLSFPVRAFTGVISGNLQYKITEGIVITELLVRYGLIYVFFKQGAGIIALGVIVCGVEIMTHIAWAVYSFRVDKNLRFNFGFFRRSRLRELLSLSVYSGVNRFAGLIIGRTDSLVISAFLGLTTVAHYAIPSIIFAYLSNFLHRSVELLGPVFSQDDGRNMQESIKEKLFLSTKIIVYLVLFFVSMAIFYGKAFITRWVGHEYLDAYPVLVIGGLVTLVSNILSPSNFALYNTSRHKFVALVSCIEAAANLVLSLILVRYWGMVGVAMGTLIPIVLVRLVLQPWYLCREMNILRTQFYFKVLGRNMGVAVIGVFFVYPFLKNWVTPEYVKMLSAGAIHAVVYIIWVWFVGFSAYEREYLVGFLKKGKNNV